MENETLNWFIDRTGDFNNIDTIYANYIIFDYTFQNPVPSPFPDVSVSVSVANSFEIKNGPQCCICMEDKTPEEFCILNCGHEYCLECMGKHLLINCSCPICRSNVNAVSVKNCNAKNVMENNLTYNI